MHTQRLLIASLFITACLSGCQTPSTPEAVLRINCGAPEGYITPDGRIWKADQPYAAGQWGYVDGTSVSRWPRNLTNTTDDPVYLNERFGLSEYRIPLPVGEYVVKLHFAETLDDIYGSGQRVYSVYLEDRPALTDFDPYKEAGDAYTAVVKTIPVEITDGELNITFTADIQDPMINGIEILK
jgi:hypothetical protein